MSRVCEHSRRHKEVFAKQVPMASGEFSKEQVSDMREAHLLDI